MGGVLGLGAGTLGCIAASRRYTGFRALTIQFRTFLAVSTGTFTCTYIVVSLMDEEFESQC